jgi:hypothetical protein
MSIPPVAGSAPPPRGISAARTTGAGFSVPTDQASPNETRRLAQTASLGAMAAMLSLQDVDPPLERDRRAKSRGEKLLDALGRLQLSLLECVDPASIFTELSDLSRDVPQAADPRLAAVMDEIRVRCAVELARREVAASHGGP